MLEKSWPINKSLLLSYFSHTVEAHHYLTEISYVNFSHFQFFNILYWPRGY